MYDEEKKFSSTMNLIGLCAICVTILAGGLLYIALALELAR